MAENALLERLARDFPDTVIETHTQHGDATVTIRREGLLPLARQLRHDPDLAFDFLMDVTAVDHLGRGHAERFEVVYHLYSTAQSHRLRVKAGVPADDPTIESLVSVWKGANWLERETYDMYGIRFVGHPDLRRIYLYEEFDGYPLRKDYPKEGRQPLVPERT